ncbi:ATP-binding protein [Sulfitobacter sp. LCG007]
MAALMWKASLKARLGVGALLLGLGTLLSAAILWLAMDEVSQRLEKALASEARMGSYSALSNQAASYLVIATETSQTNLPAAERRDRLAPVEEQLRLTFARLQNEVALAVEDARQLGLDEQSRFGTQSLGIARMQALLESTSRALARDVPDARELRPHIDALSAGFDPLLSQAVNTEVLFRNSILSGIETLRLRLRLIALAIAGVTLLALALYYFALIRPQFSRLDRLRQAAQQIGEEDFAVALPAGGGDEIGQLYGETSRMAAALAARKAEVRDEWARLNETIAERTEALRTANAALAEVDRNRRRFFADVSHELRTPLTVILMEAQIGTSLPGDTGKAFATIEARASRLIRKTEDLLRVARSESGQLQLDIAEISLGALLREVDREVSAEIASAGMTLDIAPAPEATLRGDGNWLRQVLASLLRNAVQHARSGGTLAVRASTAGGAVCIDVIDNGPGIADSERDAIFERFTRGSGSGATQGFGIGLALVRWVVEEHSGEITLHSPVARDEALGNAPGTKISVRLPMLGD